MSCKYCSYLDDFLKLEERFQRRELDFGSKIFEVENLISFLESKKGRDLRAPRSILYNTNIFKHPAFLKEFYSKQFVSSETFLRGLKGNIMDDFEDININSPEFLDCLNYMLIISMLTGHEDIISGLIYHRPFMRNFKVFKVFLDSGFPDFINKALSARALRPLPPDILNLIKENLPKKYIYQHHLDKYYRNLMTTEDLINIKDGKLEPHHKDNIKNTDGLNEQYLKALNLAGHIEQTAKETEELFRKVYQGVKEKEPLETRRHGEGSKESTNLKEALRIAKENDFEIVNKFKIPEIKNKQEFIKEVLNKNYLPLIKKLYIGLNVLVNAAHSNGTVIGHTRFLPVVDKELETLENREVTNYLHELSNIGSKLDFMGNKKTETQLQSEAEFIQSAKQKVRNMLSKRNRRV